MDAAPRARGRTTGRRIALAFVGVLALFAIALAVTLVALHRIGAAEREVARVDAAKHAGHHAAAVARDQYIHQAHTLLEWNTDHLPHYREHAREAAHGAAHLVAAVQALGEGPAAARIKELIEASDAAFWREVVPAVERDDRAAAGRLHLDTERLVGEVVELNEALNRRLEARSEGARRRAEAIRAVVPWLIVACLGLAIVAATALGLYLHRSISVPVAALRAGAARLGAGDLSTRVQVAGAADLGALAASFNEMARDLDAHQARLLEAHRLASIGQVAAGVAHELNNPIGVMRGYVKLLRDDPAHAGGEELAIIDEELRQSQRIVASLLELSRPVALDLGALDVGADVGAALDRLRDAGVLAGVEVTRELEPGVVAYADAGHVRQIVTALCTNACEAMADGPTPRVVRVVVRRAAAGAVIEVWDRGAGIDAAARARAFEPFFSTKAQGHGLGLAIARTLARAQGGDVTLADAPGGGACATLTLPARAPEERPHG